MPWGWTIANMLVLKKVREALGFQRCKTFSVGAAPITMETMEYFMSLNIPIMPLYGEEGLLFSFYATKTILEVVSIGMSESSGPHTVCKMEPNGWNPASVGKNMIGVCTKIFQPDEDGVGEVIRVKVSIIDWYLS